MDKKLIPFILDFYSIKVTNMICNKYDYEQFVALKKFLYSQTYQMLSNPKLAMWDFSPLGIFDMWESEQTTGDPRNSLYIRRS